MTRRTLGVATLATAAILALSPAGASAAKKTKCRDFRTSSGAVVQSSVTHYSCSSAKKKLNAWVENGTFCSGGWKSTRGRCTKGKSIIYFRINIFDRPRARTAGYARCPGGVGTAVQVNYYSGNVTQAKKISCASARGVVKKYGKNAKGKFNERGDKFKLGSFACTINKAGYESRIAKCIDGGRAFVVGFGL
jgi:hypothetical protein